MADRIFVTQATLPPFDEYVEEIKKLWETHWITNMGVEHEKLRQQLKEYLGVENIELLTNGHMALEFAMQAMNLSGEVITTPFTFASTTHAIVRNHLEPVFCDINPDDFTIDVSKIENLITDRTTAIVPVHVYGNVCNIEEIERLSQKYDLKVIYDAAHAFGTFYKGRGIGSYGDASCFSFHATKVLNTIEGGAVCYKDKEFGLSLYRLKNFGIRGPEKVDAVGANAKMNEFSAAMGVCNLRHVDDVLLMRGKIVQRYRSNLEGVEGIRLNPIQKDVESNHSYFPILFDEKKFGASRNEVCKKLWEEGIGTRKYFYPLTSMFECFQNKYNPEQTPVALHLCKRVLTLPLYPYLKLQDVDRICKIILQCRK